MSEHQWRVNGGKTVIGLDRDGEIEITLVSRWPDEQERITWIPRDQLEAWLKTLPPMKNA